MPSPVPAFSLAFICLFLPVRKFFSAVVLPDCQKVRIFAFSKSIKYEK